MRSFKDVFTFSCQEGSMVFAVLPFLFLLSIGNKSWGVRMRNFPGDPVGGKNEQDVPNV
jgi:hypothetical protein